MNNWISVNDRLPKKQGWVIAWDGEDLDKIWYWSIEKEFDDGCGNTSTITHWQPWPEPPEEK